MSLFPSLPNPPHLLYVFKKFRHSVRPLLDYHDRVLYREPVKGAQSFRKA